MDQVRISTPARPPVAQTWLRIDSMQELAKHETVILEHIAKARNGAQRFLTHPLLLLQELGVELAPSLIQQLIADDPRLSTLSERAYAALRDTTAKNQAVTFHLKGLFRGGR